MYYFHGTVADGRDFPKGASLVITLHPKQSQRAYRTPWDYVGLDAVLYKAS